MVPGSVAPASRRLSLGHLALAASVRTATERLYQSAHRIILQRIRKRKRPDQWSGPPASTVRIVLMLLGDAPDEFYFFASRKSHWLGDLKLRFELQRRSHRPRNQAQFFRPLQQFKRPISFIVRRDLQIRTHHDLREAIPGFHL